jgi:hypothetical protein
VILAPRTLYPKTPECLIVVFDLRYPEAEERLWCEHSAWCGFAHVEKLTADCSMLIVRPGSATEFAA